MIERRGDEDLMASRHCAATVGLDAGAARSLLWREGLGDVFERERVLHHLVEAVDLVALQHRLAIDHALRLAE
jgi:hypothetical protein